MAGSIEEMCVVVIEAIAQIVALDERPQAFDRVKFRAVWRQVQQSDVVRHFEVLGHMPAGPVKHEHHMNILSRLLAYEQQVMVHVAGVDGWGDHGRGFAIDRADRSEDIYPFIFGLLDRSRP